MKLRELPMKGPLKMAADPTISERIQKALAHHLKRDPALILPQHALRHDLGLTSLDTFELFFDLEDAFGLEVHDEDIQKLVTVSDLVRYVEGRLKNNCPDSSH